MIGMKKDIGENKDNNEKLYAKITFDDFYNILEKVHARNDEECKKMLRHECEIFGGELEECNMTEQELRDKIIKALKHGGDLFHEYFMRSLNDAKESGKTHFGSKDCDKSMYDFFADALIEAGLKFDVNYSFTAAFNSLQEEREKELERRLAKAEHRAEVAEKALRNMASNYCGVECRCLGACDWEKCKKCKDKYILSEENEAVDCLVKVHLEQAEKESKEKGNEQD